MKKVEKEKKEKSKVRKIIEWTGLGVFIALIGTVCFFLIFSRVNTDKNDPYAPAKIGNSYLPVIVQTDSMEPDYPTGTAIFIKNVSIQSILDDYEKNLVETDKTKLINIDLTFKNLSTSEAPETRPSQEDQIYIRDTFGKYDRADIDGSMKTMTHRLFYISVNLEKAEGEGRYQFFVSGINDQGKLSRQSQYQCFTEKQLYGRVTGSSKALGAIYSFATSPWGLIVLILIPTLYMIISSFIDLFRKEDEEDEKAIASAQGNSDALKGMSEKNKEKLKKELLEKMMEERKKK